jgi:hypothetical protein
LSRKGSWHLLAIQVRVRAADVARHAKGLSLAPPPLDPTGCLISVTDKRL